MPRCDVCWITGRSGTRIMRFSLMHSVVKDGRHTTRGAGSVLLCEVCWVKVAKPRMTAVRAAARRSALAASQRRMVKAGALEAVA